MGLNTSKPEQRRCLRESYIQYIVGLASIVLGITAILVGSNTISKTAKGIYIASSIAKK